MSELEEIAQKVSELEAGLAKKYGKSYEVKLDVIIRSKSINIKKDIANVVIQAAADAVGISKEDIMLDTRLREYVTARQLVAFALYNMDVPFSLSLIGKFMNKDHATVHFMIGKVKDYVKTKDPLFQSLFLSFQLNLPKDIVVKNPYEVYA